MIPRPAGDTHEAATSRSTDYADCSTGWCSRAAPTSRPTTYGETPLQPEWSGDRVRDDYEIALLARLRRRAASRCSASAAALQLINVAFGGTLLPGHRHAACRARSRTATRDVYDRNLHAVEFVPGHAAGRALSRARARRRSTASTTRRVKDLGARASSSRRAARADGIVEAIRWPGPGYVAARAVASGVPSPPAKRRRSTTAPILDDFLAARARRAGNA